MTQRNVYIQTAQAGERRVHCGVWLPVSQLSYVARPELFVDSWNIIRRALAGSSRYLTRILWSNRNSTRVSVSVPVPWWSSQDVGREMPGRGQRYIVCLKVCQIIYYQVSVFKGPVINSPRVRKYLSWNLGWYILRLLSFNEYDCSFISVYLWCKHTFNYNTKSDSLGCFFF